LLLEEVWRILKLDGKALLNIDARSGKIPDFLDFETLRFIIYKNKKIYPVNLCSAYHLSIDRMA